MRGRRTFENEGVKQIRDKTEQIKSAALRIFLKSGYTRATTQAIAKEADVAEVTLFRKFSSKRNLFLSVIRPLLDEHFAEVDRLSKIRDTDRFFRKILHCRLETLSQNRDLFKMLISESLMNRFEDDINLPQLVFSGLTGNPRPF